MLRKLVSQLKELLLILLLLLLYLLNLIILEIIIHLNFFLLQLLQPIINKKVRRQYTLIYLIFFVVIPLLL